MSESKGKRFVFDAKAGKFVPGKAAPWLPPEHMRGLPADWTTREIAEGDKIHEYDPPHIIKGLMQDQAKAQEKTKTDLVGALKTLSDAVAPVGESVPLNQSRIDVVRFRVIRARVTRLFQSPSPEKALADLKVDYLFFPENNVNKYELRPKHKMPYPLPKHLRGLKLEVDIYNWPASVLDALKQIGHEPPNIKEMLADAKRRHSISKELEREESLIWTGESAH